MTNTNYDYAHTQRAKLLPFIPAAIAAALIASTAFPNQTVNNVLFIAATVMFLTAINFSKLTIAVASGTLAWKFGPGLIRKSVPLADIASAEPIRTKWWYGWGIRITPKGWLYNVEGFGAVLVTLKSGKRFMLGTDDMAGRVVAISKAAHHRHFQPT